ncbi:MAG: HAD-IA family hydrolase [Clostridia bacterium]|nr:HAD-IA family hydrolase [Clostridia bacterium]
MIRLMIDDQYPSMPWDKIDAVVFDVGNVLLTWQAQELLDRLVPEHPELHEELTVRVFKSPYWCMRDRNSATLEEVIGAMSRTAPELEPYIRRIMTGWIDLPSISEGVEALKACKAHGVKLYALTNYADKEFAYACAHHNFFQLFDDYVVSGRLHLVKPGLEIYARLIHQFDLDPARTLFIDDSPANIEAALESGWQGLCYNKAGKLRNFFTKTSSNP